MLTQIFDATSTPEAAGRSSDHRTDRAASARKAFREDAGDGASGFMAAMLQVPAAPAETPLAISLSNAAGKHNGRTGETVTTPDASKASPEAVLPPDDRSDIRTDSGGGADVLPGPQVLSEESGAAAGRVLMIPGRHGPQPRSAAGIMPDGETMGAAGAREADATEPTAVMPSSTRPTWMQSGYRDDRRDVLSDSRGREKRLDDENLSSAMPVSRADAVAPSHRLSNDLSGGIAAIRTSTPAEVLDQVAAHARLTARGGAPEIEILLRPESLGHLRIRVSSDRGQVSVRILADKASAAAVMEDRAGDLAAALRAAGFEMARFDVSVAAEPLDAAAEGLFTPTGDDGGAGGISSSAAAAAAGVGRIDYFA